MTISQLISNRYHRRYTREGGYPVVRTTFYEIVNIDDALRGVGAITPTSRRLRFIDFKITKPQIIEPQPATSPSVVSSGLKDSGSNDSWLKNSESSIGTGILCLITEVV